MDYPLLRIAVLAGSETLAEAEQPMLVAGATRAWLRPRRTEPLAACFSLEGAPQPLDPLFDALERSFRGAHRLSVTSSLSRALAAAHTALAHENQGALLPQRRYAAGIVAAARPDGVYLARAGPGCVVALRDGHLVARTADPVGRMPLDAAEMGSPTAPHIATEHYELGPGDGLLLIPGAIGATLTERALTAALHGLPHLTMTEAMLDAAPDQSAALAIWCPSPDDPLELEDRWISWAGVPGRTPRPPEPGSADAPRGADTAPGQSGTPEGVRRGIRSPVLEPRAASATPPGEAVAVPSHTAAGPRSARPRARSLSLAGGASLLGLGLVLALAVILLRGGLPAPGGPAQTIADAGRLIQEARVNPDREAAAELLDGAITMLQPQAATNEGARALLAEARTTQDRILDVVRVTRAQRVALPTSPDFRPVGLWKSADSLFILDLGGQALYRASHNGEQLAAALRPGEVVEGQPVGRLVTAAWSPPRGANTAGQLLLVDHFRSVLSVGNAGPLVRRWWPPDNFEWQRLGAAAASYDDLFILDAGREEIWRYPARTPGSAGTVVARRSDALPLGSVVDLATDGNLYLLLSDGRIAKQAPGSGALPFEATVPHRALHAPAAIFAHPDLDHVWVLEPSESRVVEFTNQGAYVRQFAYPPDMMRNAVALHVDGAAQELRILTPQAIILVQLD